MSFDTSPAATEAVLKAEHYPILFNENPFIILEGDYLRYNPTFENQELAENAAIAKIKERGNPVVVLKVCTNYIPNHGFEIEEIK